MVIWYSNRDGFSMEVSIQLILNRILISMSTLTLDIENNYREMYKGNILKYPYALKLFDHIIDYSLIVNNQFQLHAPRALVRGMKLSHFPTFLYKCTFI